MQQNAFQSQIQMFFETCLEICSQQRRNCFRFEYSWNIYYYFLFETTQSAAAEENKQPEITIKYNK